MDYSLGFAFDRFLKNVVLIRKNKPDWQKGCLNGVGGKLELGETPSECMSREFLEETGIKVSAPLWVSFGRIAIPLGAVYLFSTVDQFVFDNSRTTTDEDIVKVPVANLSNFLHVDNLSWLIPAAIDSWKHSALMLTVEYR